MIQTRYQHYGSHGIEWTKWYDTDYDDSKLESLRRDQKWQVKDKLLNEFRIK